MDLLITSNEYLRKKIFLPKLFEEIKEFYGPNIILILKSCKHTAEEKKYYKQISFMNLYAKILNKSLYTDMIINVKNLMESTKKLPEWISEFSKISENKIFFLHISKKSQIYIFENQCHLIPTKVKILRDWSDKGY